MDADVETRAESLAEIMQRQATRLITNPGMLHLCELELIDGHLRANERLLGTAEERLTITNKI